MIIKWFNPNVEKIRAEMTEEQLLAFDKGILARWAGNERADQWEVEQRAEMERTKLGLTPEQYSLHLLKKELAALRDQTEEGK